MIAELLFMAYSIKKSRETPKTHKKFKQKEEPIRVIDLRNLKNKMTELQQKQLAFLEETVAFYNLNNRCVTFGGGCRYYLPNKEGCAIGRKIADKELCKRLDSYKGANTGVSESRIFEQLPDELKELGQNFLKYVQYLHDREENWTTTGISDHGREVVEDIKRSFGL